ncbi:VPS10 domain-containing protein [Balneola sp. MJW-20]|uniref:VPS10 domain-containing protein n=1 Tax=Gracilimonas aurantiaca TaxID=3234185 RepID=UPI003465EE45
MVKTNFVALIFLIFAAFSLNGFAQESSVISQTSYNALELRNVSTGFASGRIADIAIHPEHENTWYVAAGSGGVWKTENAGITWTPIFDNQPSYSIGSLTIDPHNPAVIWVGTGEDVGGRHVGFGDGIYKSTDEGRTWTNMGLKESQHISTILVHPEDPDVVLVAVQGPLWNKGGERGLYRTDDGGESWNKVLGDDEWTGATDIVVDPREPNVMYAATWQRHRTVAAYMGGGPGSGIHKSTDGGLTWTELKNGIPGSNLGKIGLAISPQDPDIVYAAIELDRTEGGLFMSDDRGASWNKMSDMVSGGTGPHYYQELYASPHTFGRIYLMNVRTLVSDDHGRTYSTLPERDKHSDNHALAFRSDEPDYLLMGSDGGVYETFDHGANWRYMPNLPLTQYYKVAVDDEKPFYNLYGGTQDNGTHEGPSRTDLTHGIRNADWKHILFADGHDTATEPGNPDIVYGETQQGGLHRIDRKTGEQVFIQPQAGEGEDFERFNWDAPILVSPHSPARLYFASQRVWRSDNRGDSWTPISGDLTRDQERLTLEIMGKQQSWDNPWDVNAMSNYNTITSLGESPLQEGLLYAGTDDGIIQVSEDGGENWRRIEVGSIRGVPSTAFVNDVRADLYDVNTVYAALDNHKYGDFTPYLIKSTDRGRSWESISGNLPDRHLVWRMVQDHIDPDLLFAATEFGIFFTVDGGNEWVKMKGGAPTISFRDITIQREHNDLVAASFGRGYYIVDDISPLRQVDEESLNKEGVLFDTRDALWYQPRSVEIDPGASFYTAENPPFGAVFTYYLKDGLTSIESERKKSERALEDDEDVPFPGWDALEAEVRQEDPTIRITIKDEAGNVVNHVFGPASSGFHRVNWELEMSSKNYVSGNGRRNGFPVTPGTYTATMSKIVDGVVTELDDPVTFDVVPLREPTLEGAAYEDMIAFREVVTEFQLELTAASNLLDEQLDLVGKMKTALSRADNADPELLKDIHDARMNLLEIREKMQGSEVKNEVGERNPPSPSSRLFVGIRGLNTTYGPTPMHKEMIEIGKAEFEPIADELQRFADSTMADLLRRLAAAGAPPIEN